MLTVICFFLFFTLMSCRRHDMWINFIGKPQGLPSFNFLMEGKLHRFTRDSNNINPIQIQTSSNSRLDLNWAWIGAGLNLDWSCYELTSKKKRELSDDKQRQFDEFLYLYIIEYHTVKKTLKERYLIGLGGSLRSPTSSTFSPRSLEFFARLNKLKQVVELTLMLD